MGVVYFVESISLFAGSQHGFHMSRSTTTAIIEAIDKIAHELEEENDVHLPEIDLRYGLLWGIVGQVGALWGSALGLLG